MPRCNLANRRHKRLLNKTILWFITSIAIIGISSFIAIILSLDYDYHAILVAYIFYIFRQKPIIGAGLARVYLNI